MPFLSLPFAERSIKDSLRQKYSVRGIPTLVVLDPSGATMTKDGRSRVMGDQSGSLFPWEMDATGGDESGGCVLI